MSLLSTTYAFAPETAELVAEAFERIQLDPEDLQLKHIVSARRSINYMLAAWSAGGYRGPLITTQQYTLTLGQIDVPLALPAIDVFNVYLTRSGYDVNMYPISRSDYEAIPNKTQQGRPTMYFTNYSATINQVAGPTLKIWQASQNTTDIINVSCLNRFMDAGAGANALQMPYMWYEAAASGLAARLAEKWKPVLYQSKLEIAVGAFQGAMSGTREKASTKIRHRGW